MTDLGEIRRYAGSGASGGWSEVAASHTGSLCGLYLAPTHVTTTVTSSKENSANFEMGAGPQTDSSCYSARFESA